MNCPICNITLLLAEKQGVEIDYCPKCRGIWLDKGKLEKIVEKLGSPGFPEVKGYISDDHHPYKHDDHHFEGGHRRKKGMFDFFD